MGSGWGGGGGAVKAMNSGFHGTGMGSHAVK